MKKLTLIFFGCLIVVLGLVFSLLILEENINFRPAKSLTKNKIFKTDIKKEETKAPENLYFSYFSDKNFYEAAYTNAKETTKPKGHVYGGIVTHHLLASNLDASFFKALEGESYKRVIILAPNHYEAGQSDILTSDFYWDTPYGYLEPDKDLINKLTKTELVQINNEPFAKEHSISAIISFIKKSLPQTKVVPLIMKFKTTQEKAGLLAQEIDKLATDNTLVIASVDFSHFQPSLVARFHDELSSEVIESFSLQDIYKLEIDSPASIYALLSWLKLKGAEKSLRIESTNSAILTSDFKAQENTSYLLDYFIEGAPKDKAKITLLSFGDMMLDRNVEKLMLKNNFDYPFAKIKGKEERFLKGVDIIIANLEGAITDNYYSPDKAIDFRFDPKILPALKKYNFNVFDLANNHSLDQGKEGLAQTKKYLSGSGMDYFGDQTSDSSQFSLIRTIRGQGVCFIGFNNTDKTIDYYVAEANIKKLKSECNWVLVFVHWGVEYKNYFNENQQQLARKFIDWGADAVIGGHPHVAQGIEIYKEKPIFYSLGNFIFDQYFSEETQKGFAVGLVLGDRVSFYLFPFKIPASQPELMDYNDSVIFFDYLIGISEVSDKIKNQLKTGKVEL